MVILKIYCGYLSYIIQSINSIWYTTFFLKYFLPLILMITYSSFILFSPYLSISVQIPLVCPEVKLSPLLFSSPSLSPSSSLPSFLSTTLSPLLSNMSSFDNLNHFHSLNDFYFPICSKCLSPIWLQINKSNCWSDV